MCPCPQTVPSASTQQTQASGTTRIWDERTRRIYPSSLSRIRAGYPGAGTAWQRLLGCPLWGWRLAGRGAVCPSQPAFAAGGVSPARALLDVGGRLREPAPESYLETFIRLSSTRSFLKRLCDGFRPRLSDFFSLPPAVLTHGAVLKVFCDLLNRGKGCWIPRFH